MFIETDSGCWLAAFDGVWLGRGSSESIPRRCGDFAGVSIGVDTESLRAENGSLSFGIWILLGIFLAC